MKAPRNTSNADPVELLLNAMAMGPSRSIEHQAAQGQREFTASDTLPMNFRPATFAAAFEAAGGKLLDPVNGDSLFRYAQLPPGWKKIATDHSMWSKLLDDKGRERASIFYKAAFYDRDAFLNANNRLGIKWDYEWSDKNPGRSRYCVMDGTVEIAAFIADRQGPANDWTEQARNACEAWLNERYPDWQNPGAYWDLPPVEPVAAPAE